MKFKIILLSLLSLFFILTNSSVLACKGTEVLFQDNFAKLDPSWGTPNDELSQGHNTLTLKPNLGMDYALLNQSNLFQDMDYCADVHLAQGDDSTAGGGLAFWGKDYNDYYFLYILGDGSYYVGRYVGGRYIYPVSSTKDPVIQTGNNAVNHLRVVTKGNQATIYINDKQLATFTGQPPQGGGLIGVAGDSGNKVRNTWEFSNLKITKPS